MTTSKTNLILLLLWFLVLHSFLLCMASTVRYYDFVLKETNFTRRCYTKSMLTVNGSFPGPVIKVRKGDLVYVNVHNQGKYGVTIHWHGVKQPNNPWSDGPENVTQCPIPAGASFKYKVILSDEEGTLWWHAHSDWSRATVHGAFVIRPASGKPYPFTKPYRERILLLGSWYNGDLKEIIDEGLATGGNPNISNGHTINGYTGNLTGCTTEKTYQLKVKYGKTYLLRIINAVMNDETLFGVANHNLTVVGMDGAYLKPFTTDYIYITPGQTMDVLLKANQTPSEYYIVSSPYFDSFAEFDNSTAKAIVKYEGDYSEPSPIPLPTLPAYNDGTAVMNFTYKLKSLASKEHPVNVPKNITKQIFMTISLNILPCPANETCSGPYGAISSASLNNISFVAPKTDILQAYYRGMNGVFNRTFPHAPNLFNFTGDVSNISMYTTTGTKVIPINWGEEVEIVWQGTAIQSPENHPMHLHGFSFYLVGIGEGNWNKTARKTYNLVDPPLVNTIGVPQKGWAAIRFTADNAGVWFMHCHLERHASWGMDTAIVVKNGPTKDTSILPQPPHMPPCSSPST